MELALLAWVAFGLRLRKLPLRSLLGQNACNLRAIVIDCGIALLFWIASLMVLGTLGIAWLQIQAAIEHRPLIPQAGQTAAPDPSQLQALRAIKQLAPSNPREMGVWALLCMLVGFIEEVVFRGYLQRQFTAWARGATAWGVALSAIVFGAAHGYQGLRNMVLLSVFGALFSGLVLLRRSLRPAIIAHGWHDLIFGFLIALLNSQHLI
jgi:membrane protease YdiL (CAAX protease family)